MKKIFVILLTMVIIATMFIGCSKENSEAVNATTEPTTSTAEAVNAVVEEMTEDINIENITTDENGTMSSLVQIKTAILLKSKQTTMAK